MSSEIVTTSKHIAIIDLRAYGLTAAKARIQLIAHIKHVKEWGSNVVVAAPIANHKDIINYSMVAADNVIGRIIEAHVSDELDVMEVNYEIYDSTSALAKGIADKLSANPANYILQPRMFCDRLICFDLIYTGAIDNFMIIVKKGDGE